MYYLVIWWVCLIYWSFKTNLNSWYLFLPSTVKSPTSLRNIRCFEEYYNPLKSRLQTITILFRMDKVKIRSVKLFSFSNVKGLEERETFKFINTIMKICFWKKMISKNLGKCGVKLFTIIKKLFFQGNRVDFIMKSKILTMA